MSIIKKYSTGQIGNEHADHSDRGNPNTKGLDSDNRLGIEAYIEEDSVVASTDNRPLKNLVDNDVTLENNLADVASEVDKGVFLDRYEDFDLEILSPGDYPNPLNKNETINVTPIRIKSGSSIINGRVTRIGQQKIIYFLRKDDENSILFPDYEGSQGVLEIQINDENYFGEYEPVYDTVADGLPDNFKTYTIRIANVDSNGFIETRYTTFDVYRDWEDIIPLPAEDIPAYDEEVLFNSDENYGQFSEGYRLLSNNVTGTKVSDVEIKKDILVKDELFNGSEFTNNLGVYEAQLRTEGLFFDDVQLLGQENLFTKEHDIQDAYISSENDIYFITRDKLNKYLFLKKESDIQIQSLSISENSEPYILMGIIKVDNYLFIYGTDGLLKTFDLSAELTTPGSLKSVSNFITNETVRDIKIWDSKIWIATDKILMYTDRENFDPEVSTFAQVDLSQYIKDIGGNLVIDHTNVIVPVTTGYYSESSLESNIKNLLHNPSYEDGGVNNTPLEWSIVDELSTQFIINSGGNIGNYKAVLTKTGTAISAEVYQDYKPFEGFTLGDDYTFSTYLKSGEIGVDSEVQLIIEEWDILNQVINTASKTVTAAQVWDRFSITHSIVNNQTVKLRIKIMVEGTSPIQIDNSQLEIGDILNPYTENFEYLVIGFRKNDLNKSDPSFALIDARDKYRVKYTPGIYGDIHSINDAFYDDFNRMYFLCDCRIFSMNFLNETDEYDRISISSSFSKENNIEKFETIQKFNDKIYFGGTIKNQVISFNYITDDEYHSVEIGEVGNQESLSTLLGGFTVFKGDDGTFVEFETTQPCLETKGNTEYRKYIPGKTYYASIVIDGVEEGTVAISAPVENEGPWELEAIYSQIVSGSGYNAINNNIEWIDPSTQIDNKTDWRSVKSSSKIIDGFYSFGGDNLQSHIRGDIHKIILQEGNSENFYIIRGSQIFKSKFDPNLLKDNNGEYNLYEPILNNVNTLQLFNDKVNEEIIFTDNTYNRNWVDIPVDEGYNLSNRDFRVKTNLTTEVGFVEGKDYFVDYEENKIIRLDVENILQGVEFSNAQTDGTPLHWNYITISGNSALSGAKRTQVDSFSEFCTKMYIEPDIGQEGIYYQIYDPQDGSVSVGQTYTFSVYLRSDVAANSTIRLSELDGNGGEDIVFTNPNYTSEVWDISAEESEIWKRFTVSHTVTSSSSTKLRVEIKHEDIYQLFIAKPQLERNPVVTDFVVGKIESRINPDAHVWVDFIQKKTLIEGASEDYSFDINERKLKLFITPEITDRLYLEYKYEKIFNAHDLGDSIPQTTVSYNTNDDYFLYKNEGRIFAINQMMAMLSLDTEDPLIVSYNYHYPRIDVIKIRNTPDAYGNLVYLVKGEADARNPYRPNDIGTGLGIDGEQKYYYNVPYNQVEDSINNEVLYEINVTNNDYSDNDIYDRRIYVDARFNKNFNISLYPETLAYFPFQKDFNSTNGFTPLNFIENSKIVPIIKYYSIIQQEEVGAWHDSYQLNLRIKLTYPAPANSIYVDPINGNDLDNSIGSATLPFRTINAAKDLLYYNNENDYKTNIIIANRATINENVEITHNFPVPVKIVAETFSYWSGALKNNGSVKIQGIWFQNSDIYPNSKLQVYYCTFENTSMSLSSPQFLDIYNSEIIRAHNSFIRINEAFSPNPFTFPYARHPDRDDGVVGIPESVATSDTESIHPGDEIITTTNTTSSYYFENCLIYDATDHIVDFDTEKSWSGTFRFNYCTIVNNRNLFSSDKYGLSLTYENSIIFANGEEREGETKIWDTNSTINLDTCFIDFTTAIDVSELNFKDGGIIGRETCIGGSDSTPSFVSFTEDNYYLKSTARGFDGDSICLNASKSGIDIGCYAESREQTEKDIPKKLRNYVAFINEGISYPITINSEKITMTMEFKPTGNLNDAGIIFDTRSSYDDEDYIVLAYNNNNEDDHSLVANQIDPSVPYRFRLIVKNKEASYAVISPIEIKTDEQFSDWHRLTFVINYEEISNLKIEYADYDRQQNIINFYHNDVLSVESYIKYDMNRDENSNIIPGRGNEGTNAWNYNNINQFITLASDYNGENVMNGYYTELRIDNRFIDRKQFELWDAKVVPFNDPLSYVNQAPLTKSLDSRFLSEYWGLKDREGISAKGNKFKEGSSWRYFYDNAETAWFIGRPTDNLITYSTFDQFENASIEADNLLDFSSPIELEMGWNISTVGSNIIDDDNGQIYDIDQNTPGWVGQPGYQELGFTGLDQDSVTGLSDGSTYNYKIAVDGSPIVDKSITINQDARAYQELGLAGIASGSQTGLNAGTTYYFNIELDTDSGIPQEYSITPSGTTYFDIINELNTLSATTNVEWQLVNGDVRATSNNGTSGPTQTIQLSEGLTGIPQITDVGIPGDLEGSLAGDYWGINSANDANRYFVWYEITKPAKAPNHVGTNNLYSGYNWSSSPESFSIYYNSTNVSIVLNKNYYNAYDIVEKINEELSNASVNVEAYVDQERYIGLRGTVTGAGEIFAINPGSPNALTSLGMVSGNYVGTSAQTSTQPSVTGTPIKVNIPYNSDVNTVLTSTVSELPADFNTTLNAGVAKVSSINVGSNNPDNYSGKYFRLFGVDDNAIEKEYTLWFNSGDVETADFVIDNVDPHDTYLTFGEYAIYFKRAGTSPTLPTLSETIIVVEYPVVGIIVDDIATLVVDELTANAPLITATKSGSVVTLKNNTVGNISSINAGNTNFNVRQLNEGREYSKNPVGSQSEYQITVGDFYNETPDGTNTNLYDSSGYQKYILFNTPSNEYYIILTTDQDTVDRKPNSTGGPLSGTSKTEISINVATYDDAGTIKIADDFSTIAQKIRDELVGRALIKSSSVTNDLVDTSVITLTLSEMGETDNYQTNFDNLFILLEQTHIGNTPTNISLIGKNLIEVDITENVAFDMLGIATAISTSINSLSNFSSSPAGTIVNIISSYEGNSSNNVNGDVSGSALTFNTETEGIDPNIRIENAVPGPTTPISLGNISGGYLNVIQSGIAKSDLFDAINGFVNFDTPVPGKTITNVKWSELLYELNGVSSDVQWQIVDGDIRCTSNSISNISIVSITAGDTDDLLSAISSSPEISVPGYSKIVLYTMDNVRESMNYIFNNSNSKIDWGISSSGKLKFITKSIDATEINGDFSNDFTALGFNSGGIKSGSKVPGLFNYDIVDPAADTIFSNEELKLNSNKSITLEKTDTNNDSKIYTQNISIESGKEYVFSMYVESNTELTDDNIGFYSNEADFGEWDSIKRINGTWYLLVKTFTATDIGINLGISVKSSYTGNLTIDSIQLEKDTIPSPFVEDISNKNDVLIINNSIISKEYGTIHFRFKPMFDFYGPKKDGVDNLINPPKILFEMLGIENGVENLDLGIRGVYYFSEEKNRGIVEITINGDNVKWELELVNKYWEKWHSVVIAYDFINKRYSLWFDYFNYTSEADTSLPDNTTDLYIGHGYPSLNSMRSYSEKSADILVKDIIITDFPTSDSEIKNWVQTYEFYSDSFIVRSIEGIEERLINQQIQLEDLDSATVLTRLDQVENKIDQYNVANIIQNQNISNNLNTINNNIVDISEINSKIGSEVPRTGILGDILNNQDEISAIKGTNWSSLPGADLQTLREDVNINSQLINQESLNRNIAIGQHAIIMASTSNGEGASLIGVEDALDYFVSENVEAVLAEINSKVVTNTTTIISNSDSLTSLQDQLDEVDRQLQFITDGTDGATTQYNEGEAALGYNIWSIADALIQVTTSIDDGASGADLIAATPVGSGTATTVQGILEELEASSGGGTSSIGTMNEVYHEGSLVTVDTTDIKYNLGSTKKFTIADSVDASKFVIEEGNGLSSVRIGTTGGIDISSGENISLNTPTSSIDVIGSSITLSTLTTVIGNGDITLNSRNNINIEGNVLPSSNSTYNLGDTINRWNLIAGEIIFIGDNAAIINDSSKLKVSYDSGTTSADIIDTNNFGTQLALENVDYSNLINVPTEFTPSTHYHDSRYYQQSAIDGMFNDVDTKIEELLVPATSGAPSDSPAARTVRFDVATDTLYIYNGTTWVSTTLT